MFGDRLKMARHMARLSLRALAEKAGVSHNAVHKYERGDDVPGSDVLLRLAEALGVTVGFLLRPLQVTLTEPAYRHRSKLGARDKAALKERVREEVERWVVAESLRPAKAGTAPGFPKTTWEVESPDDIERAAEKLREQWDLGSAPIANLTALLEERGVIVCRVPGFRGFDALTYEVVGHGPAIAVNAEHPGDRQRFSLAHEMGHLLLSVRPPLDEEKATNRFAGAFLAPRSEMRQLLGDSRHRLSLKELEFLKQLFGISMLASVHRAADLQIISDREAVRWYTDFGRVGWRKAEPGPLPPEQPKRLRAMVLGALAEGAITESRAAELLGCTVREVRDVGRVAHEPRAAAGH